MTTKNFLEVKWSDTYKAVYVHGYLDFRYDLRLYKIVYLKDTWNVAIMLLENNKLIRCEVRL